MEILTLRLLKPICHLSSKYTIQLILSNSLTCLKNPSNSSCTDLFLSNNSNCFQRYLVFETGFSDCHKFIVTVIKSHIPNQHVKIIEHRNYKGFNDTKFRRELPNISHIHIHENRNIKFFRNNFLKVLNMSQ